MESMNLFEKGSAAPKANLIHYQGELGDFWYDPKEFEVHNNHAFDIIEKPWYGDFLHYVGHDLSVSLPEGCTSTRGMFYECKLPKGFHLSGFDTSNVKDMSAMFRGCKFPAGFSLGDKFDTSNVEDMCAMFYDCKFPSGFTLGGKFDTSNVEDMRYMFAQCKMPAGFTLGAQFDTSNVGNMCAMFRGCEMPIGFTLGERFDTSNVKYMDSLFHGCKFPLGFTLGDKFNTSNVEDMSFMFCDCKFPEGFSLGNKFSIANGYLQPYPDDPKLASHIIVTAEGMFAYSTILGDFDLGKSFKAEFFTTKRKDMFSNCILPAGAKQSQFHTDSAIIKWLKARHLDKINQKQDQ